MKKIINFFVGVVVVCGLGACANLDINPLSEGSSENWYSDETEIQMSLNDLWRNDFFPIDEVFWSDDVLFRDGSNEITAGTMTSQSSTPSTRWSTMYKAVSRSQKIIAALEGGKAAKVPEAKVKSFLGQAYFMMGFAYGELTMYFGDCVLSKADLTLEEAFKATRSPKSEVLAYAYECLDKAASLLPETYSGTQIPTVGAALGFKARFALYHGDWAVAVDACEKVMALADKGIYKLHDNYQEFFKADTSPELMWYFKGDMSQKVGIGVLFSNLGRVMIRQYSGGAANHSPSVQLACAYTCIDGLPIDESPLYNPKDPFENRDPRMKMTIQPFKTAYSKDLAEYEQSKKDGTFPTKYPEYINHGFEYNPSPYATTVYKVSTGKMVNNTDSKARNQHSAYNGLMLKKFVKDEWVTNWTYAKIAYNVYPYLRYAEILMSYIEAKNELGQVTQADLDKSINKVRERAYKGSGIPYPKVTVASQAALRKIIRMERRIEFAWENDRYNCLRRWGIMEKTHNIPMYYLNRSWSGGADWNGKVEGSNRTLSADFLKHLKNWDDGNFPFGGIPQIDENGIPDVKYMEDAGYIVPFYQMHFEAPKNYLWPIPANDILVNENLTQNPGW